jgi:spore coat polysaccharide biosynthesis protein SpsF
MRTIAIVQARIGSSRLPAKVMLDLGGRPALFRCLSRVAGIQGVADVVVATSTAREDDVLAAACRRASIRCVRGPLDDVLTRYLLAAEETHADAIVRITSDCPLLDPRESSRVVAAFNQDASDYVSNVMERTYPRGLDTEIISRDALLRAGEAATPQEREHVTQHIYRHPETFRLNSVVLEGGRNLSAHRWTLDTLDDYLLLAGIFERLGDRADVASLDEVLAVVELAPALRELNAHVQQKPH